MGSLISTSIIGLVVEFVVAIDEARVRFTDDALFFFFLFFFFSSFCFCQWLVAQGPHNYFSTQLDFQVYPFTPYGLPPLKLGRPVFSLVWVTKYALKNNRVPSVTFC